MIDNSLESYRHLSTIGAGLGNDINKVRLAAAQMGLSISEYNGCILYTSPSQRD